MKTATVGTTTRKAEQSRETQGRLLKAAKELFTTRGYQDTALEDVVARAGMTRGALYHQYADKQDLFRAVFQATEEELGQKIAMAAAAETDPWEQLRAGARAVLETATDPAIRRIVLTDGPSVLGWEEWRRIDEQYSIAMVRMAFEMNIAAGNVAPQPIGPLAHLIVGALNEASLAVAAADEPERARAEFIATFDRILEALRMVARAGRRQQ